MNESNPHECANCNSYGSFTDKEGNLKNKLIWYTDSNHYNGGYYLRDESNDSKDDKLVHPCASCACHLDYTLNGNPYYGISLSLDENNETVINYISLDECAENNANVYASRKHKFLDSFKIQDWSAKFPNDLFTRTVYIYNSEYNLIII